jgi:hypothetical protein
MFNFDGGDALSKVGVKVFTIPWLDLDRDGEPVTGSKSTSARREG